MRYVIALLLCGSVTTPARGQAARQSMPVAPRASITILSDEANIRILGADQAEVEVTGIGAELRGSPEAVTIDGGDISAMRIVVPRDARVMVRTGSGSVVVTAVTGSLRIDTRSGGVNVTDAPRSLVVVSSSGDITVRGGGVDGTRIENGSGRVSAHVERGGVDIESLSGEVSLTGRLTNARVFSVSGVITAEATLAAGSTLDVESALGLITLRLPAAMPARYELQSTRQRVQAAFGPNVPRRRDLETPVIHHFQVGAGTATIRATSIGGSVILEQQ